MRLQEIPLHLLFLSSQNTRHDLQAGQEDSGIDELAASIRKQGLLSPLTVRSIVGGKYEVIAGQRRLAACQKVGLDPVPCLVRDDIDDADAVTISLVENVHRADMNPLDKATALKALYEKYNSYERVAQETAWSTSTVRKYIKLLDLPNELQQKLSTSEGPAGVAVLAKLASTFSSDDALDVYNKLSGFRQSVQEEILKRSGGDVSKVDALVDEAVEGAFDIRQCGGRFRCEIIKDILEGHLRQSDFQALVTEVADNLGSELKKSSLREAARDFWRSLARS
ncbi:MAG TPA: ParB/RepB/Spo0J family partition protein [Candidatus Acidoferrales bacterium]|nr:ParB/RepB/Spo0J family partition protein [Candidatus Acidoferrales bacterium]